MRKQYRDCEGKFGYRKIFLYHDGELVKMYSISHFELEEEINHLEHDGYRYGFTAEEVDQEKRQYEYMLARIIKR